MKILIRNISALLDDGEKFYIERVNVSIDGERIFSVGEIPEGFIPDKIYEGKDKLLMPGLINSHTHAYMSLFRNSADDLAFNDWLFGRVEPVEDLMTEEDVYWGTLLSIIEMFRSGTTSFVDMNIRFCLPGVLKGPKGAATSAAAEAGARAVITRGLAGALNEAETQKRFEESISCLEMYKDHPKVRCMFGPHAPYTCMADSLVKAVELAKKYNTGLTIHLSESQTEIDNMAKEHGGVTPIKYVADLGVFDVPTIAAHCVYATDDDIRIMKEKNVSVAINPKSNMKLGNGFSPAEKFLKAGLNVCLGTDGPGSNNTQNMFAEMNTAALVYKGKEKKAQCVSAMDVLRFATAGGARAISPAFGYKEGELGVIKEGAIADLIIIDLNRAQFYPRNDIISGLVYSAKGSEVETVIIGGEPVMENGTILTIDEEEVFRECEKIAARVGLNPSVGCADTCLGSRLGRR